MKRFVPDDQADSVLLVTPDWLTRRGLFGVLADLDNTLGTHGEALPRPAMLAWASSLREASIALGVVSNNRSPERVRVFCRALGVPFIANARKPSPKALLKMAETLGHAPERLVLLGDNAFTDIPAARRAGMRVCFIRPLSSSPLTRLRMSVERLVVSRSKSS